MSWEAVRTRLDPEKYELFHFDIPADVQKLASDAPKLDAAFICMHGRGGEDGNVQGMLELLKLPYQGSGVLASALAMNKKISKELYLRAGLCLPQCTALARGDELDLDRFSPWRPLMVKPVHEGSSMGMSRVERMEDLAPAVETAFRYDREVLVEEYVSGTEVTGAVVGLDDLRALPLVEIVPKNSHAFFDFAAKYDAAETDEICPARVSGQVAEAAQQAAVAAHRALGCRGYSRTDMIVSGERVYVLETNTIPGMTVNSLLPKAAAAAGIAFPRLLDMLIEMAMNAAGRR